MENKKHTQNVIAESEVVQDGEFMLEPVPENKRRSTRSQIMVWIGFGRRRGPAAAAGIPGNHAWHGRAVPDHVIPWSRRTEDRPEPVAPVPVFLWTQGHRHSHGDYGTADARLVCQHFGHDR